MPIGTHRRKAAQTVVDASLPEIAIDDFCRRFELRSHRLMWFLGAGASASAGIPTAHDMIWDFKRRLYVSQRRVSPQAVSDLSDPFVRRRIQEHISSSREIVGPGHPDEYAELFETVYPSESDRRRYIDAKIQGGKPSYGHIALASLMREDRVRIIWTTNFDPLIADACAQVYGSTGSLTTLTPDTPQPTARGTVDDERWPIEVKLHGDFRSRRLRNTKDELRQLDAALRESLVQMGERYGMVVIGYSGRDNSVMNAFEEIVTNGGWPSGFYWLYREDNKPSARVVELMTAAIGNGIDASFVRINNFDESLQDLVRLIPLADRECLDGFASKPERWSPAPVPSTNGSWPIVRLNAIPVLRLPTFCRRVECAIGGYREVSAAFQAEQLNVPFARVNAGVLCFGRDDDIRRALSEYSIREFDLYTIDVSRLRFESGVHGLIRASLAMALARSHSLRVVHRRHKTVLVPRLENGRSWTTLQGIVGSVTGELQLYPGCSTDWTEAVSIRLALAQGQPWMLFEPEISFSDFPPQYKTKVADFVRERTVRRYNKALNDLLNFWAHALASEEGDMAALNCNLGVDAVFRLSPLTAFSRRV